MKNSFKFKFLIIALVIIILFVCYYFFSQERSLTTKPVNTTKNEVKITPDVQTLATPSSLNVLASPSTSYIANEQIEKELSQFTPEEIRQKFSKSRNNWLADPSISEEEKRELIENLAKTLFPNGDIPIETEDDKIEQKRINHLILNLKKESQKIKDDTTISFKDKQKLLENLLKKFLKDMDQ